MTTLSEILALDNILGIVLLFVLVLWHLRGVKRDQHFFDTMNAMIALLRDCQEDIAERPTPRD